MVVLDIMKIDYVSDIHLEFDSCSDDFMSAASSVNTRSTQFKDTLVLAGDINIKTRHRWVEFMSFRYKHVVYVFGNHEYYGSYIEGIERKTRAALAHCDNVHILQNESVALDGVTFHGATLWSDFEKGNPLSYMACGDKNGGLNDFRLIRIDEGKRRFTPTRCHTEHNVAKVFLRENVKEGDVVVTHHAPTYNSIAPKYRGSKINGAFASDLSDVILETNPKFWFHGHTHSSSDYMVGNTRVLCNPRGYAGVELNQDFNEKASVEYG